MTGELGLFAQINNAVLDLQAAHLQSFDRPLKTLARLLSHSDLGAINKGLTSRVDLESFLAASASTQGSMVGSGRLNWPEDEENRLGLVLLMIQKFADDPDSMIDLGHTYFYSGSKVIAGIHAVTGQVIVPFARDYRSYVLGRGSVSTKIVMPQSKKVFIVHGHDEGARESVARFVERIGLDPVILHEQANKGRTVIEKVEANSDVTFAVVILTPDDEGCRKGGTPEPRARENVLLELGYFIGKLGRERVCALKRGVVEIPSDFAGVVWESMDGGAAWKQALGRELAAVGHTIDWNVVMRS